MRALVLAVATYADPSTRRMFDRIAAQGVEVLLAMPRRIRHPFGPAEVPETPWPTPGVRLERLDTWYLHENGTHVIMKGIPRLIRQFRPDVIHCVMEPWSITCLQVLATLRSLPGARPRFGVQPCETKPEQGGLLARILRRSLYKRVTSRCDYLVGWSGPVSQAAARLGLNGQPVVIAPAVGIDVKLFRPAEAEERLQSRRESGIDAADAFVVGYVGRFVEEKGICDLVAAMDQVIASLPRARLVLLGDGPLLGWIRSAASTRPWLKLIGRRDQPGVARFMHALDVLVLPSRTTPRWEEQFGLVAAEAMASGVPVIGSDCGAIPGVIGEAGWGFPQGDRCAIASFIQRAAGAPDEILSKGLLARGRACGYFSDHVVASTLLDTWESA